MKKIKKSQYKAVDRLTRSTAPYPENIYSLIPEGIRVKKAEGEADVGIAKDISDDSIVNISDDSIVISGDSDLLFSSGPKFVAIPIRERNTFSFIVRVFFY